MGGKRYKNASNKAHSLAMSEMSEGKWQPVVALTHPPYPSRPPLQPCGTL